MYVLITCKYEKDPIKNSRGERGGSMVECRTPEREVGGSKPTAAVLCPWARHFTPRKYWLITQEAVAPSRHDWKIVYWDVKPQHKQTKKTAEKTWRLRFSHFKSMGIFSDAQGQLTPYLVVRSGRIRIHPRYCACPHYLPVWKVSDQ